VERVLSEAGNGSRVARSSSARRLSLSFDENLRPSGLDGSVRLIDDFDRELDDASVDLPTRAGVDVPFNR
jgi:hypothetical protein